MKSPTRFAAAFATLALLAATGAAAQTLYKLIDRNGKVTYSEKPPKEFDGKVVPLEIDPHRNSAALPKYEPAAAPKAGLQPPGAGNPAAVRAAHERVEVARQRLQDARDNPGEGDYDRMGNAGGGTRPVLNESYHRRVAKLEEELLRAEAQLQKIEGTR